MLVLCQLFEFVADLAPLDLGNSQLLSDRVRVFTGNPVI